MIECDSHKTNWFIGGTQSAVRRAAWYEKYWKLDCQRNGASSAECDNVIWHSVILWRNTFLSRVSHHTPHKEKCGDWRWNCNHVGLVSVKLNSRIQNNAQHYLYTLCGIQKYSVMAGWYWVVARLEHRTGIMRLWFSFVQTNSTLMFNRLLAATCPAGRRDQLSWPLYR